MDQEYLLCAISKHQQHTSVIPASQTIPLRDSSVGPTPQIICLRHDILAECNADLELNRCLIARKLLPVYHDCAPQLCRVSEIFRLRTMVSVIVFSPAISPNVMVSV